MAGLCSSFSQRPTLLVIFFIVCNFTSIAAWIISPSRNNIQRSHHKYPNIHRTGWSTTQLSYRDENDSLETKKSSSSSDFLSRMKRAALQSDRGSRSSSTRSRTGTSWRPPNIKAVVSLEDFYDVIQEGRMKNQLVVVRFYATWCKKCHALRPSFDKVAASQPQAIFVEVPVTNENASLHQGLGVTSVPFTHIYCPEKGLIVEEKMSRSRLSELVEKHSS